MGYAIYKQSVYFTDQTILIDQNHQNRIKEFQFCKQFSCPPYKSLQETPKSIMDTFSVIEEEYNNCVRKHQEDQKNA